MSDLKPCPFCNSTNINAASYIRDGSAVICRDCSATTRAFNPNAREKAVSNWNRRAAIAAVEAEGWQLVPVDDATRNFSDSALPPEMIEAGCRVQDRVNADNCHYVAGKTTDWDFGMVAVAIYRAMLASAPKPAAPEME